MYADMKACLSTTLSYDDGQRKSDEITTMALFHIIGVVYLQLTS